MKKTKQLAVRVTPDMADFLTALADKEHRTLSGQLIHLLMLGLQTSGCNVPQTPGAPWNSVQDLGE